MRNALLLIALAAVSTPVMAQTGAFGPQTGDRELTLSGTGASDKSGDNATFGVSGELGWYISPQTELGVRQSVNYADLPNTDDNMWNGATRGFADYHFGNGRLRPFVGASLGGIYGDGVNDSGFAGPELGVKYYVREKTFVTGRAEYQFFFDNAGAADEAFDDGAWAYTLGMGYNF